MLTPICRHQQGFSLIEVLVAVIVMAVGVLGNAALQTSAIKYTQSAYQRADAVALAYDMADRIRANIDEIDTYAIDGTGCGTTTADNAAYATGVVFCSQDENGTAVDCNSGQMVQYDQWRWTSNIIADLPSGKGLICRKISLDGTTWLYEIAVQWKDKTSTFDDDGDGELDPYKFTLLLQK